MKEDCPGGNRPLIARILPAQSIVCIELRRHGCLCPRPTRSKAWTAGNEQALEKLTPLFYKELHRVARRCMAGQRPGHPLQTTELVNEAYLRLVNCGQMNWQHRAHFFAMSAQLMRRILIDIARSRGYQKRGGGVSPLSLDEAPSVCNEPDKNLVALDDALKELAAVDERKSKVVELKYFGGLSIKETAEVLSVSVETVVRDWRLAKIWLLRQLSERDQPGA
jgi:RNA polymerase sigma-70 factor, ECF subfamily